MLNNIIFLFKYSWKISKKRFAGAGIDIVLKVVEPFVNLIFPTLIINELTGDRSWHTVLLYIGIYIGCILMLRLLRLVFNVFINMSINECDVKNGLFYNSHYLQMDYSKLEDENVRDLQQEITSKVQENDFVDCISMLITSFLTLLGFVYIISMLEPIILLFIFIIILINLFINKKLKKNEYEFKSVQAKLNRKFDYLFSAMTTFDYAKEIRVNKVSNVLENKFHRSIIDFENKNKKFIFGQLLYNILSAFFSLIQMIVSYGYVAYFVILRKISVGQFYLYTNAIYNLTNSFNELVKQIIELRFQAKCVDDYKSYISLIGSKDIKKEVNSLPVENNDYPMFEFDNVSFTYPNTDRTVLKNISIKINKGEKLSIVGMNGAGKTTFIKLLCRLYTPTKGCIKYFGVDISTIKRDEYYKLLAVVLQDFKIFSFSFFDNIVLNQDYDRGKLEKSIINAGLKTRVENLPKGVMTNIYKDFDESGIEFSGGEGQKLVIARAYYKDASLVILDEPTAALDAIAENQIYNNFNNIVYNKTSIFISHRLSSTKFCDVIAVFNKGEIVEYGNHKMLMDKNGLYYEMFNKQADYYKQSEED